MHTHFNWWSSSSIKILISKKSRSYETTVSLNICDNSAWSEFWKTLILLYIYSVPDSSEYFNLA